jgi:hypothetical protein
VPAPVTITKTCPPQLLPPGTLALIINSTGTEPPVPVPVPNRYPPDANHTNYTKPTFGVSQSWAASFPSSALKLFCALLLVKNIRNFSGKLLSCALTTTHSFTFPAAPQCSNASLLKVWLRLTGTFSHHLDRSVTAARSNLQSNKQKISLDSMQHLISEYRKNQTVKFSF